MIHGCTTWTLIKFINKKLDGNCTRMQRVILNKSWKQHPTKQQLYGHLLFISKTIIVRGKSHAGLCRGRKNELINDVLLWTPPHGRTSGGQSTRIYLRQLYTDTECSREDMPEKLLIDEWCERVREIRPSSPRHNDDDDDIIK